MLASARPTCSRRDWRCFGNLIGRQAKSWTPDDSAVGVSRLKFAVPKTSHEMIVDHSDGLHERVADGGANEPKTPALQFFAHRIRLGRVGGNFLV